ncbi:hypothetical protein P691DRAFT_809976, partial [Macrolepiota fuliginosa MF-IS2]
FLRRPLKSSDIHILGKYTHRVRSFQPGYSLWDTLLAYRALSSCSYGHLLPKLERLVWRADNAEVFPYLRFFLSPTLKALSIAFDVHHREQLGFLGTIPMISPTISELRIIIVHYTIFSLNDRSIEGFSDALLAWHNLSELDIFGAPLEGLLCAAQMPNLKRLSIHLADISERSLPDLSQLRLNPPHASQPCYPALESLALLSIQSVAIAVQFFEMLQSAKLSSLELEFIAPDTTLDHFRNFFSILVQHCDPSSLKVFQFNCWDPQLLFSDIVSPLFVFPELKEVRLMFGKPMGFSEEQISQVASSWPHLEVLQVRGITWVTPCLKTTLFCLVPLASGCPKLRELHLWIDASDGATRRALRANPGRIKGVQNWALRHLDVQSSPISHKEFVASFLSDIFPSLEDISPKFYGSDYGEDATEIRNTRRWQYIAQVLLPMLSRSRIRDYEHLGVARPQIAYVRYDTGGFDERSARRNTEKVEGEDGEWSDPEQLIVKGLIGGYR